MGPPSLVDHRSDIRHVVRTGALELADDHIDDIQCFDLETSKVLVELGHRVPNALLRKEGNPPTYDLEVKAVPLGEIRAFSRDCEKTFLDFVRETRRLQDVAVLRAAL